MNIIDIAEYNFVSNMASLCLMNIEKCLSKTDDQTSSYYVAYKQYEYVRHYAIKTRIQPALICALTIRESLRHIRRTIQN